MCGILGAVGPDGSLPDANLFAEALDLLNRRGPDGSGIWSDTQAMLGHRRLAIVELSNAGSQPMQSSDGRYVIVFNGEIYNHMALRSELSPPGGWRGSSDTETLLECYATWGSDCVSRLNGMFALAIWDRKERTLFLARDRFGVKPLYYRQIGDRFLFASRPSPLDVLAGGVAGFDTQALRLYFELSYIPAPLSFVRGTRKLPQAHYLLLNADGARLVRYWDYRHIATDQSLMTRSEDSLLDELDALLRDAVASRLMSDVSLGAFLSGGIDSALIVASMKAAGVSHPRTFTIGFKEQAFDEAPAAAAAAHSIGVDHTHETLAITDLLELLPAYLDAFDEPLADNSAFATMAVSRLARRHVTVALTGDAGDELFGGYPQYQMMCRLETFQRWPAGRRKLLRRALQRLPLHRSRQLAGALARPDAIALFAYIRNLSKYFPPILSVDALSSTFSAEDWFEQTAASFAMDLHGAEIGSRLDIAHTLADCYLQKVDVATMAYSLEGRCPFTDYRVAEWAMRLPLHFKIRNGQTKYILKRLLCRYLPSGLVYKPKMGFSVPVAEWLRGPLKQWALELLHDRTTMDVLPLDQRAVLNLFDLHNRRRHDASPLLWSVLMLLCHVSRQIKKQSLPQLVVQRAAA
jgi:asparagine synthase (glutamine-hydrolysing)